MKREEKIEMIQEIIEKKDSYIGLYAELLLSMGDMKLNYRDYMITEPINCSEELKRVFTISSGDWGQLCHNQHCIRADMWGHWWWKKIFENCKKDGEIKNAPVYAGACETVINSV